MTKLWMRVFHLVGMTAFFLWAALMENARAQDPARPDLVVPVDFTVKVQLKSKKPIGVTRTFDNKVLEIKDVLDDPTSVFIRGLAEGAALVEMNSKDGDREEIRVLVIRQQIPVTNLDLVKKATYNLDHLTKTLRQVTADIKIYPLTTDSIFMDGEVLTLREMEVLLRLASKVVDPAYMEEGKKASAYTLTVSLKSKGPPAAGGPGGAGAGSSEQISVLVSAKVISGLRVKGELTSFMEKVALLEETIRRVAPKSSVQVLQASPDSALLKGKVESEEQKRQILQIANRMLDPDFSGVAGAVSPRVISALEIDTNAALQNTQPVSAFDINHLRNLIKKAVPNSNIEIVPITRDSIILSGFVSRAEDVPLILNIANNIVDPDYLSAGASTATSPGAAPGAPSPAPGAGTAPATPTSGVPTPAATPSSPRIVNALKVAGVQQVQLDVVVAQISRSEFRRLGFNFFASRNASFIASTLGNLGGSPVSVGGGGGGGSGGASLGANGLLSGSAANNNVPFGVLNSSSGFLGFIQALRTENASKLLAEPKLVTLSGHSAYFLVGGRQAVLSAASGVNGPGAAFQEVGTDLRFVPVVLGNGKIFLSVQPRVRSVNNGLGITTSFGFVPGFDEKQVDTSVEMEAGQTLVLGGLIQNELTGTTSKVPILGDLPFIGVLFSTKDFEEREQEVVILVTPHLVDPLSRDQAAKPLPGQETRAPDDFELFLEGILEAPRGPRKVFQDRRYIPAFRNAPPLDAEAGESRVPGNLRFQERKANPAKELPLPSNQGGLKSPVSKAVGETEGISLGAIVKERSKTPASLKPDSRMKNEGAGVKERSKMPVAGPVQPRDNKAQPTNILSGSGKNAN